MAKRGLKTAFALKETSKMMTILPYANGVAHLDIESMRKKKTISENFAAGSQAGSCHGRDMKQQPINIYRVSKFR